MHSDGCHYLYASPLEDTSGSGRFAQDPTHANKMCGLDPVQSNASSQIVENLSKLAAGPGGKDRSVLNDDETFTKGTVTTPLAAALSMATCYCNFIQSRGNATSGAPRILCLQGSEDSSTQYIATMNAIFSAQRAGIPIDSCVLGDADSAFLQQAAHITGGLYAKPRRGGALLQYLLSIFSADTHSRKFLQLPNQRGIDFHASCFCHKRQVDAGFVCSVCLSIFCDERMHCPTCGADFTGSRPG